MSSWPSLESLMLNYPPVPPRRKRRLPDSEAFKITCLMIALILMLIGVFIGAINTKTEEVATGRPLQIIRGHLQEIEIRSGGKQRMIEESMNRGKFNLVNEDGSLIMQAGGPNHGQMSRIYYDHSSNCLYLQEHLIRTTYFERRVGYHQYTTFEGARTPNPDNSCPEFPVD
ncbi:hypothetical protein IFT69_17805 [Pseudomonas putida]|nr:hypothetical protein [Pseudomonas putida]